MYVRSTLAVPAAATDYTARQMLFTWDTQDLCIIFKSWHIYNTSSLIWSLFGVVLLTAGYELVREISRRYEAATSKRAENLASESPTMS